MNEPREIEIDASALINKLGNQVKSQALYIAQLEVQIDMLREQVAELQTTPLTLVTGSFDDVPS